MTPRSRKEWLISVSGALFCLSAYGSADHTVRRAIIDQGGGYASSSNYELRGSVGGPVIATGAQFASSTSYLLEGNRVCLLTRNTEDSASDPAPGTWPWAQVTADGGCAPGTAGPVGFTYCLLVGCLMLMRRRSPRNVCPRAHHRARTGHGGARRIRSHRGPASSVCEPAR